MMEVCVGFGRHYELFSCSFSWLAIAGGFFDFGPSPNLVCKRKQGKICIGLGFEAEYRTALLLTRIVVYIGAFGALCSPHMA
jgi:hypothetical protein